MFNTFSRCQLRKERVNPNHDLPAKESPCRLTVCLYHRDHDYSGVPVVGPVDYTRKGVLWDPVLNYVAAAYDCDTEIFIPLSAAEPTTTSTAPPPAPGEVPSLQTAVSSSATSNPNQPAFNASIPAEDVITVLTFRGRWGNSFSDIKKPQEAGTFHKLFNKVEEKIDREEEKRGIKQTLGQKLEKLKWAEGPSGPRWKSLERKGVTWNTELLLPNLDP